MLLSRLMAAIKICIGSEGNTQREVAGRFNVAQPRISEIYQGKIELFFADKLINMLARVGWHVAYFTPKLPLFTRQSCHHQGDSQRI